MTWRSAAAVVLVCAGGGLCVVSTLGVVVMRDWQDKAHYVGVHRWRNAAGEVSSSACVHIEVAAALTVDLVLEIIALKVRHRRHSTWLRRERHGPVHFICIRHRTVEGLRCLWLQTSRRERGGEA